MCYLYTSRPSLLFSVELKGCAFQVSSIVSSSYTFPQPNLCLLVRGVYWSKDKQTRNLVSFDPANFEMSKIYQGNFQSSCRLAQLFLDTSAVIFQKERNRWRKFFFQPWKCSLVDLIEIPGNRCANTNIHYRKLKHPTVLLFWTVLTANL